MAELSGIEVKVNCAACGHELNVTGREPFSTLPCPQCGAQLTVPKRVAHFLLLSELGAGGIGSVYRAMDLSLRRFVAVKLLKKELAEDAAFIADFSREARAAAALNHPNIAQVYSFGVYDGQYYLVMELVERGSLDTLIEKRRRLSEIETLEYGIQIASALRAAYQRGVIHRDVKPGNMLIGTDGTAKLVDFGLARFKDLEHAGERKGALLATPYYIAPEKLHGQNEDFRSDMYSLGGTLFHCVAGRPPFEAPTASDVVQKNLTAEALSLKTFAPDISDATALLFARLLRKNPQERYPDYDELIHDLELAKRMAMQHAAARARQSRPARSRVRVTVQAVGWTVLVGATIVLLVLSWDKIFKTKPAGTIGPEQVGVEPAPVRPTPPPPPPPDLRADFRRGHQKLNTANFADAVRAYTASAAALKGEPDDRDWSVLMLGTTHLMEGDPQKAQQALLPLTGRGEPQVPDSVTYAALPGVLAWMLADKLPAPAVAEKEPAMPPWARAAYWLAKGAKEFSAGRFEDAASAFTAYLDIAPGTDHRWLFEFRNLTSKFTKDIGVVTLTLEKVAQLQQAGQFENALGELAKAKAKIPGAAPLLHQRLAGLEPELKRAAEQARREEEERRREEERRKQEALQAKIEAEKKLIDAARDTVAPLVAVYAFDQVVKTYESLKERCTVPETSNLLAARIDAAGQLVAFKKQLIADINAAPYTKNDLVTVRGATLTTTLERADAEKLVFIKRIGQSYAETEATWTDFAAPQLARLAEHYTALAAKKQAPSSNLAERSLALAVFLKYNDFRQKAEACAREAVRHDPALKPRAAQIFGSIFE